MFALSCRVGIAAHTKKLEDDKEYKVKATPNYPSHCVTYIGGDIYAPHLGLVLGIIWRRLELCWVIAGIVGNEVLVLTTRPNHYGTKCCSPISCRLTERLRARGVR